MEERVRVPVPVEETRGGEGPGDWQVCGSAEAHAAAVRAQLAVMETYEDGGDDGV